MNKEPTKAHIKELSEWLRLRLVYSTSKIPIWVDSKDEIVSPTTNGLPTKNLNNLFKYMPKEEIETVQFSWGDDGCNCWLYMKKMVGKPFYGNGLTEEDALFWALYSIKEAMK